MEPCQQRESQMVDESECVVKHCRRKNSVSLIFRHDSNRAKYLGFLGNDLSPALIRLYTDVKEPLLQRSDFCFQQDEAPPHYAPLVVFI